MFDILIFTLLVAFISRAITSYVVLESGPFDLFTRIRYAFGVKTLRDSEGYPFMETRYIVGTKEVDLSGFASKQAREELTIHYDSDGSFLGDVFSCVFCMTPYATAVAILICYWLGEYSLYHLLIAYLGAIGIVHRSFA